MYKLTMSFLILFCCFSNQLKADQSSKQGNIFMTFSLLTGWYQFDANEVRENLPDSTNQLLSNTLLSGTASDELSYGVGIGYYVTRDLRISLDYNPNLTFGEYKEFLADVSSTNQYDSDLDIFSFEIQYNFLNLNEKAYLFAEVGFSQYEATIRVYDIGDISGTTIALDSFDDTSSKFGFGAQWDVSEHLGFRFGYSHSEFLSTDKAYINFEYRF